MYLLLRYKIIIFYINHKLMSNLKLKLNEQGVSTRDIEEVKEVTELEFWSFFIRLLNISMPYLTKKELAIMSCVLAGDEYKSQFRGKERKRIANTLGLQETSITQYKVALIKKGYLKPTGEILSDVLVTPSLRKLQMYVKEQVREKGIFDISFINNLRIKND